MEKPYTERFLQTVGQGTFANYYVPSGKRASVKSIVAVNNSSGVGRFAAWVHDLAVMYVSLQAFSSASWSLTVAAYAGERIHATSLDPGGTVTVAGFLFDDPTGAKGPPGGYEVVGEPPLSWDVGETRPQAA